MMSVLVWLLEGLVVGASAGRLIPGARARSNGLNIALGVAGALFGGFIGILVGLSAFGIAPSLAVALLGAFLFHVVFGIVAAGPKRTAREAAPTPSPPAVIATPPLAAQRRQPEITPKAATAVDRPHIFLSYATADRPMAKALAAALSEHGFNVWWDRTIPPGKSFDEVIEQALDSARCVMVLWTKSSTASNWVRAEAAEGLRRQILVPVVMEDVRIPLEFRRIQAANLADWQPAADHPGFASLLSSVADVVGPL